MAAASPGLVSRITEITTCSICLEDFKYPRSLPCLHSFCLQCLQGHYKDKCPGDDALCPLCRKEFQIPRQGLVAFPTNFVLQNLIDARDQEGKKPGSGSCEACSVDQNDVRPLGEELGEIAACSVKQGKCLMSFIVECTHLGLIFALFSSGYSV